MSSESYSISCIRRLREYGEGIVLADQCISTIKEVVKNNTYIIIGMSQTGQKDRREMTNVLGLNADQASAVNFLDVGQGIIRLAGRYPFPQLIKFPFVKPENLSETKLDEINAKDKRVLDLLSNVNHATDSENNIRETSQNISEYTKDKEPESDREHDKSIDMLKDIFNRFDVSSTQRTRDFNISASSADKIFKYIEREQFVEVVKLNLSGTRGGISKYYDLTNKGYEAISKKAPKRSGGIGSVHFFLERYLKKYLPPKGFSELEIEKNIGGKRIDLYGKYDGLLVGIEICVSTVRTEHINVHKDINKCDILIITTPDKKTKDKLDSELSKRIGDEINLRTCVVHELLNYPGKIINRL